MTKDIFSQIKTAHRALLSLNTKRPSFVYLVTALNKVLKEKNIVLKIYCQNSEIKNELQNLDPYIQDQFIDNFEKTTYSLKLKKGGEAVEKIEDGFSQHSNTISANEVAIQFESKNNDISLDDFEFKKDSSDFDLAIFFGDISNTEIEKINSIKTIKQSFFLNFKKDTRAKKIDNQINLSNSHIQFFFDILDCFDFNNTKEVYTLLLTSILLESNNLSNSRTPNYLALIDYAINKGGIFSIAQNYLAQNNIKDIGILGNILTKTKEIAKNVYYCELHDNSSNSALAFSTSSSLTTSSGLVEDIFYILKKLKNHKLIILKIYNQNRTTFYLTSTHPRIDLSILKTKFAGSGYKNYYKFGLKEHNPNIIIEILDMLSLEYSIPTGQRPVAQSQVNNIPNTKVSGLPQTRDMQTLQEIQETQRSQEIQDTFDPLKPATEIPEPLIFFKKSETIIKPQSNKPLPSAS
jgi:hypothetical protein